MVTGESQSRSLVHQYAELVEIALEPAQQKGLLKISGSMMTPFHLYCRWGKCEGVQQRISQQQVKLEPHPE